MSQPPYGADPPADPDRPEERRPEDYRPEAQPPPPADQPPPPVIGQSSGYSYPPPVDPFNTLAGQPQSPPPGPPGPVSYTHLTLPTIYSV